MKRILMFLIRAYQIGISPWLGPHCRFSPSCSEYAREALETYGALKGFGLVLKRILSCHPFHPGGCQPVKSHG